MKKMILLLILPLTASMAIDFKMTEEGLFAQTTTQSSTPDSAPSTAPGETNPYLEPVNLPECDAGNPEVQFIRSAADWKNINSSSKRIFCVSPGDYRSLGEIKLTVNGTAEKRRYIILNNGNDTHPGKLESSQVANYALHFNDASYWTIDRMSTMNQAVKATEFDNGSSYNILNRMYTDAVTYTADIGHLCHNNTIQNGRFENQIDPGYDGPVCIQLFAYHVDQAQIHNTKVINNEFYNQNDGFQIVRFATIDYTTPFQDMNAEGTIVDGNLFTIDIPYMENAVDIKAGSDNPNNPVIISNNIMWGYHQYEGYGDPGTGGPNPVYPASKNAIGSHYSPKNVHIRNNIMYDSSNAFSAGSNGPSSGFGAALIDGIVENNIFYRCGQFRFRVIEVSSNINLTFNNNYFVDNQNTEGLTCGNTGTFLNNVVANPYNGSITFEEYIDAVSWSNCKETAAFRADIASTAEVSNAAWDDFTFTWGKFTNKPQQITLDKVIEPGNKFPKWN